jgi:hypothetical protein
MELFKLFLGDISFLEKMCTRSWGSSGGGGGPGRTWTGFKTADIDRLLTMGGSFASGDMGANLSKLRPKLATLGEKMKTRTVRRKDNRGDWKMVTETYGTGKPTEDITSKEDASGEITRLMGLFRKRQQEVQRGKAAPGRKSLRAEGTGAY